MATIDRPLLCNWGQRALAPGSIVHVTCPTVCEVGRVVSVGDGIACVHGVESAMVREMLEFPGGLFKSGQLLAVRSLR